MATNLLLGKCEYVKEAAVVPRGFMSYNFATADLRSPAAPLSRVCCTCLYGPLSSSENLKQAPSIVRPASKWKVFWTIGDCIYDV